MAMAKINGAIRRLSGYEIRRAAPPAPARPAQRKRRKAKRRLPPDYDAEAKATIRAVRPYTMTSPERINALIYAVRHVVAHDIPGDIVECGVWRGGSMQAVAKTLLALGRTDRDLHLFDTFEGMPPPTDKDVRWNGIPAKELLEKASPDGWMWAVASLDDVKDGLSRIPYPAERIHYVQGLVQDTVPARAPETISILRLDTDWYESTRHELTHLYPRLVSGGVLLIDDYGCWQGSRAAVDEFLEQTGERLLLLRMDQGRIAVKP